MASKILRLSNVGSQLRDELLGMDCGTLEPTGRQPRGANGAQVLLALGRDSKTILA